MHSRPSIDAAARDAHAANGSLVKLVAGAAAFMAFLDATIVIIAFPAIERSFAGVSRANLAWIVDGYYVIFAAGLVPAGRLADRYGPRRMLEVGIAVFVAASLACAGAPSAPVLVASRLVQALGASILAPASLALVLAAFPLKERIQAVSLWGAGGALAACVGPALGGLIVSGASWRLVFLINLPVGALIVAGARRIPEIAGGKSRMPDLLGTLCVMLGVGSLALAIVEGHTWGWSDARIVGAFAAAIVLIAVAVLRSSRHPAPAIELDLLRRRSCALPNVGTLAFALAFYALIFCNVLFLTGVWHYSALRTGLAITPGAVMATVVAGAASGAIAERYGYRPALVLGVAFFTAGIAWYLARIGTHPHYLTRFLPGNLLTGTGIGFAVPAFAGAATTVLPNEVIGIGSAFNSTARQIGAVLGVAIVVAILGTPRAGDGVNPFDAAWIACVAACAVSLVCALVRAEDESTVPVVSAAIASPAGTEVYEA